MLFRAFFTENNRDDTDESSESEPMQHSHKFTGHKTKTKDRKTLKGELQSQVLTVEEAIRVLTL